MVDRTAEHRTRTAWLARTLLMAGCATLVVMLATGCQSLSKLTGGREVVLLDTRGMVPAPYADGQTAPKPDDLDLYSSTEPVIPMEPIQADIIPLDDGTLEPLVDDTLESTESVILPDAVDAEPVTYTVKKGDSLWKIARMYGVTHQELAAYNDMKLTDVLQVGKTLRIPPGGVYDPSKATSAGTSSGTVKPPAVQDDLSVTPLQAGGKYTVRKGDSLWKIARRFGVKSNDIKRLNNLKTDTIFEGQVLVIPGGASVSSPSIAPPPVDDVLTTLTADNGGMTVETSTVDNTQMETSQPPDRVYTILEHTVLGDENLADIAGMYGTSVARIQDANPELKDGGTLKPGMEIKIPLE